MNVIEYFIKNILLSVNYLFQLLQRKICGLEEREEMSVDGKVCVITGANSGLGKATALELAMRGGKVVIACRNQKAGEEALKEIKEKSGSDKLFLFQLDLGDLSSVRKCAEEIKSKFEKIHLLICNAGIANASEPQMDTKDGFESNLGVNHLGHFLFTNLLLEKLKLGAPSRVVVVSSTNQLTEKLDFEDLMLEKSPELRIGFRGYDNSKFANSLFAKELAFKLQGTGISTYSLCPGLVDTNVFKYLPWYRKVTNGFQLFLIGLKPEQGVETILYCSLSKKCAKESGLFYRFSKPHFQIYGRLTNEKCKRLWSISEKLVGLEK